MKLRWWLLSLFVLALVAGCGSSPKPEILGRDDIYLDAVKNTAEYQRAKPSVSDHDLVLWAQDSCYLMSQGYTPEQVLDYVTPHTQAMTDAYTNALSVAVALFCPEHMPLIVLDLEGQRS